MGTLGQNKWVWSRKWEVEPGDCLQGAVATLTFHSVPAGMLMDLRESLRGLNMSGHNFQARDTCKMWSH